MAIEAASAATDAEWNVGRQIETPAFTTLLGRSAKLREERI